MDVADLEIFEGSPGSRHDFPLRGRHRYAHIGPETYQATQEQSGRHQWRHHGRPRITTKTASGTNVFDGFRPDRDDAIGAARIVPVWPDRFAGRCGRWGTSPEEESRVENLDFLQDFQIGNVHGERLVEIIAVVADARLFRVGLGEMKLEIGEAERRADGGADAAVGRRLIFAAGGLGEVGPHAPAVCERGSRARYRGPHRRCGPGNRCWRSDRRPWWRCKHCAGSNRGRGCWPRSRR